MSSRGSDIARSPIWAAGIATAVLLAACAGGSQNGASSGDRSPAGRPSGLVTSNVFRSDYAGAKACDGCHADIASAYANAPMHDMTRDAKTARIAAPFDGAVFRFKEDTATLTTRGADRFMTIASNAFGNHEYRVTKVIGGRHREDFAGVELKADGRLGDEEILPVSWLVGRRAFRYKGYSVMSEERPGLKAGPTWRETCIFCHNTAPAISSWLGALVGEGAPGYQGVTVDRLLPSAKRATYRVASETSLTRALDDELSHLRGAREVGDSRNVEALLATVLQGTRSRFDQKHLVDVGIGCEACHGGARAHAERPSLKPSFAPRSDALRVELPERPRSTTAERAMWINRACARCHQVLFSGYAPTWEGGLRNRDPGGSHINSGEARDFMLGACASEMACTTCHDPHAQKKNAGAFEGGFANDAGDAICTSCHAPLATEAAKRAHTHHAPASAGSRCVSCHMPRKNMGLDGKLTRYHRISSPNDPRKVENDRPLECALCHGDKSVATLVSDLERWWGKRYDRSRLGALYGSLSDNVLSTTLARGRAHEQAVALAVIGERRQRSSATAVAELLGHRYPLVREYARDALEAIVGAPMPVDLHRERDVVLSEAREWLKRALEPSRGTR